MLGGIELEPDFDVLGKSLLVYTVFTGIHNGGLY